MFACAVAGLAIGLTGCGGDGGGDSSTSNTSASTPDGTVQSFFDAAGADDAEAACALLTDDPGDSGNLLAAPAGALPSLGSTCAQKVHDVNSSNPGLLQKTADEITVETTQESPTDARVELTVPGSAIDLTVVLLVKQDDEWKIDAAGAAQFFK